MRLAFVHFPGRLARLARLRAGDEVPTEFLFGAVELERSGHDVAHYEVDPSARTSRVARRVIDDLAARGVLPPHLSAAALGGTRRLWSDLARADVVVATTTGTAMALAAWRGARLVRVPLVGIVAGLVNDPWRSSRRVTTRGSLRRMHAMLYGPGELEPLLARAPDLAERVHVNTFGVDTSFWAPEEVGTADEVVAIGNDGHRDWATLVRAASSIPATVRILTSHPQPADLPANVTWERASWHDQILSDPEVRDVYRRAAVVVVPVRDVVQPSGQSVTLQAMACARPVVLSRTRGLWSQSVLRDGETVSLVPPGDAAALADAVARILADPSLARRLGTAARCEVEQAAQIDGFAERLLAICSRAIEAP